MLAFGKVVNKSWVTQPVRSFSISPNINHQHINSTDFNEVSDKKIALPETEEPRKFRVFADQQRQLDSNKEKEFCHAPSSPNKLSAIKKVESIPNLQGQILAARIQLNGPDPFENRSNFNPICVPGDSNM